MISMKTLHDKITAHGDLNDALDKLNDEIIAELNNRVRRWLHIIKDDPDETDRDIRSMIRNLDAQGKYKTEVSGWSNRNDMLSATLNFGYEGEESITVPTGMVEDPERFFANLQHDIADRIADNAATALVAQLEAAKATLANKHRNLERLAGELGYTLTPKEGEIQ